MKIEKEARQEWLQHPCTMELIERLRDRESNAARALRSSAREENHADSLRQAVMCDEMEYVVAGARTGEW